MIIAVASSSMLSTRCTPWRSNSAWYTASSPAMAPECETVSFADSSVRPTFSATIGIRRRCAFSKARAQTLRIARGFHEQPDDARRRLLEREIQVLVHRHGQLLAGRHDEVEVDALLAVDDAAHAGAGMADVGDVAAARVHARLEAAGPHAVHEVVEAHAVRAANQQARPTRIFARMRSRSSGGRSSSMTRDDIIVAERAPCAITSSSAASSRASLTAKITCSTGWGRAASVGKQGTPQTAS